MFIVSDELGSMNPAGRVPGVTATLKKRSKVKCLNSSYSLSPQSSRFCCRTLWRQDRRSPSLRLLSRARAEAQPACREIGNYLKVGHLADFYLKIGHLADFLHEQFADFLSSHTGNHGQPTHLDCAAILIMINLSHGSLLSLDTGSEGS